jgi:hypothetical protein
MGTFNGLAVGTTGSQQFVGTIAGGLPVLVDANVPTNQGTSTNEDRVFVARVEDFALWEENSGVPRVFNFEQTQGPGIIRLAVYGVSAFTAGRYPSGVSMMQGSGLVSPSF